MNSFNRFHEHNLITLSFTAIFEHVLKSKMHQNLKLYLNFEQLLKLMCLEIMYKLSSDESLKPYINIYHRNCRHPKGVN